MAAEAAGWRRMWGPHDEASDQKVRMYALLWSGLSVVWLVVIVLALTLGAPTSPLLVVVYALALAAAMLNVAIWVRAGRLRRFGGRHPSARDRGAPMSGLGHELFGRGGFVDRASADRPWPFGLVAGLAIAAIAAAIDALLGGQVNWILVAALALASVAIFTAKGYQRRRALAGNGR